MSDVVRRVLAAIPGWEQARAVPLGGGLSNQSWLLDNDGRKAVLKIDERAPQEPLNSRHAEAQIQTRAAAAGLAGAVIDTGETHYLSEFVEGTVWSAAFLDDDANLEKLAAALRKLHSLPLTGRCFDAFGAARTYADRIGARRDDRVADCLQRIAALPRPQNLCCCHNDLVAANIICTPDVRFLDWEYACDNDPFFDLATIVAHHELPPERADYLLDAYFDGDGLRWREQLARQVDSYDALLWLWRASRP